VGYPSYLLQVVIWGAWGLVCPVSLIRDGRTIGFQGSFFVIPKEGLHDNRLLAKMQCVKANPVSLANSPRPFPASSSCCSMGAMAEKLSSHSMAPPKMHLPTVCVLTAPGVAARAVLSQAKMVACM
jgi:hypothetical protein